MWIELVVPAPVALTEAVASELVRHVAVASAGVQLRKDQVVLWVQTPQLEEALEQVRGCVRSLAASGWKIDPDKVKAGVLAPEEEWRDAWKKYFHVTRLTRQVVVVPSWETYQAQAEDIVIHLDPGQAFGTGAHASTQLILEEMQTLYDSGFSPASIFDLGTGSGILAIVAAKFWPSARILATDVEAQAIAATQDNAQKNGVLDNLTVSGSGLGEISETFPLILANIQAHILRDLQVELTPKLAPQGHLLLSGILSAQIASLCELYAQEGLETLHITQSTHNSDWSSGHIFFPGE